MARLYVPLPLTPGAQLELPANPAAHVRARRLSVGDRVTLFDGNGGEHPSTLLAIERRRICVEVGPQQPTERELPARVVLMLAVVKGERMDVAVEKATELGVGAIVPLLTERTVVRLEKSARAAKRRQHWRAVAASACEQCGRNRLPEIDEPRPLAQAWATLDDAPARRLVLSLQAEEPLSTLTAATGTVLLIGPEGGLSNAELAAAAAHGFIPAAAGRRTLRTETAAIAALSTVVSALGEL
ncbi:16S rRNA (uracil(1498)-N(3))-methyltransferase [Halorhodospira abdelmalekii]|uniref:16S rRNA (uracil(1498)-N(3))-methyltransferase n=1 Tax=Halorhodospira abdelmalekii TaxID=421629 RepID=UPI0019057A69|nr:16S rRNA (uracil(1498)-N(3))-methyltransferase [Halorhodospira abdelmalekii]MBK1735261.1 16S rRNA (uracil(1498)-N(3))-methyltransferase [Halorhodospira abdelmalekii]